MNAISVRFSLSFCINNNYKSNKYFDVQNCTNLMNLTKNYFYKHKINKQTYLWNNKKKNSDKQLLIQNITLLLNKLVYSKFNCSFQLH